MVRITDTGDLWWKTAVFYNLDVKTYLDWNDDGTGDFEGLAHRLDYLAELGVTCLWLAPFFDSPRQDNGYDISDYYAVHPDYGHLGDFVEVVRAARDRGMRVIVDLVVNHTSAEHAWFQASRSDPESRFRDFYVWRDEKPEDDTENMFPDVEDGVWFRDEVADAYYRHTFYRHQPDLNTENQAVRDEIAKVIGFWLQAGADGFRVDAVPYLIEGEGGREHDFLQALRGFVSRRKGDGVMLGEVNLPYDEQLQFFGDEDGDELTMQFDFVANQALYLALARGVVAPLVEALEARPALAVGNQWGNFVRNHDELTLDQLSAAERDEVFEAFAPEPTQRIHGRGITRRIAGMVDQDPRRLRMIYSLIFSLPGAPVLYYGEEIGMAEHPDVKGRTAVRSPMQWTAEANGGFSAAPEDELVGRIVPGGASPLHVNASAQRGDPDSLFSFMQKLIVAYRSSAEIGWGRFEVLAQEHPEVLVHRVDGDTGTLVAVHNFASDGREVSFAIDGVAQGARVVDLTGGPVPAFEDGRISLAVSGYGHHWFRILEPGSKRLH